MPESTQANLVLQELKGRLPSVYPEVETLLKTLVISPLLSTAPGYTLLILSRNLSLYWC